MRNVPTAPKLPDGQRPSFRRLGDPKSKGPKPPERGPEPGKGEFRGLGRDDLDRGKGHAR